jgi:hypothetical protein
LKNSRLQLEKFSRSGVGGARVVVENTQEKQAVQSKTNHAYGQEDRESNVYRGGLGEKRSVRQFCYSESSA